MDYEKKKGSDAGRDAFGAARAAPTLSSVRKETYMDTMKATAMPAKTKTVASNTENSIRRSSSSHKSKKKGEHRVLSISSTVYAVAFKFYDEQLPDYGGFEKLKNRVKSYPRTDKSGLGTPLIIEGIRHDRDARCDDFWDEALEKPHYHVIARCTTRNQRVHVGTILNALGIVYRKGIDDALIEHHGIETVSDFNEYTMYLTHETPRSEEDGKALYGVSDIFTNLSEDELTQVRQGYAQLHHGNSRVDFDDLCKLNDDAYKLGKALGDWDAWLGSQPFAVQAHSKLRAIRESYNRGLAERLQDRTSCTLLRMAIFITGGAGQGKTFSSTHALRDCGLQSVVEIAGQKTGKYDSVRSSTQGIIVDDDSLEEPLVMADNYICLCYRRNSDNRPWAGTYLVVTSNLSFEHWAATCGIQTRDYNNCKTEQYRALLSRYFVCHVDDDGRLFCENACTRGTPEEQAKRFENFTRFRAAYETYSIPYCQKHQSHLVDASCVLGYSH